MLGRPAAQKSLHTWDVYEYAHPVPWQKFSLEASGFNTVKTPKQKNIDLKTTPKSRSSILGAQTCISNRALSNLILKIFVLVEISQPISFPGLICPAAGKFLSMSFQNYCCNFPPIPSGRPIYCLTLWKSFVYLKS